MPKRTKKEMKKPETKKSNGFNPDQVRKQFTNKILEKNKGLTLTENKRGAIQIKRDGALLFSFRQGEVIVTHPMFTGKGKSRERVFKHGGTKWDHLSAVPHDQVTLEMLQSRVNDKKTPADYHKEFYGNNPKDSGLVAKREAAKERAKKSTSEAGKAKGKKKKEQSAIKRTAIKKGDKRKKAAQKVAQES